MMNDFIQRLHLEPRSGWLNDPNGLCFFNGEYHVYFQYAPDSAEGKGLKCWGHWCSPDMLKWRFTGTVLKPDIPEDRNGVYSGCGFVKGDTLYLFYTGNVKEEGDHDYIRSGRGANVILVTTKDGHNMSAKRVLLRNSDYPDFCSCHVRDPKVWEENGKYHMVLGARTLDDKGCVLFYESDDLYDWHLVSNNSLAGFGYMWECPDVFELGRSKYLSISPQGLQHEKYRFQNIYSSGHFVYSSDSFEEFEEWDYGFDFYAPQTFDAPDGRKILIGWEGIGDIPYTNPTVALGWQHCLTLPRELTARDDGVVLQTPIRELMKLRKNERPITSGNVTLPFELCGRCDGDFSLELDGLLKITYHGDESELAFLSDEAGCGRTARYAKLAECGDIRVIADTSSVEIYLNGGEKVLSTRMYPADTELKLCARGVEGMLYGLDGIEVTSDE